VATSNTYSFGTNTQLDALFDDAFERIGIIGNELVGLNIKSAIMSANLELTSWQGKVPLSWTRKRFMTSVYPGQSTYLLPKTITRVLDVVASQPVRLNSGGTAISSAGGSPANCFNPQSSAGCTQVSPDGSISYDYGVGNSFSIQYVGITPLAAQATYKLVVEYSFDNVNWFTVYTAPSQLYFANQVTWFVIENAINARAWRIRETGGATLAIQQIYFSQANSRGPGDRYLTSLSYTEWMQIPTKNNTGNFPSSYFYNEQIQPTLTLWPVPSVASTANQFTALIYTAYQYSQDIVLLFQTVEIPQRFYDALVAGIAARLAVKADALLATTGGDTLKMAPEKIAFLKQEANDAFQLAALTEFQSVPLRFQPDMSSYR
jgi:hypothetical protein